MTDPTLLPAQQARSPQTQAAHRLLDAHALASLAQLDPTGANQLLPRVLSAYRSSLARLMGQLVAARSPFQPDTVKLVTHTLKSSSASVGALGLSSLCGQAEQALRDARLDDLPAILDTLEIEAGHVAAAVHQLLVPS